MTAQISGGAKGAQADWSFRKRLMEALSRAPLGELQSFLRQHATGISFSPVRGPETGLVMVRGRIGGGGSPFNLGEVTVTRASVRLDNGFIGHGHVLGGNRRHAEAAAVIDAMAQMPEHVENAEMLMVGLEARRAESEARLKAETAATKVDFFTLVRGED